MIALTRSAEPAQNAVRYAPGRAGHVESYFLRANDPARPRALWLKATILAPLDGPAVAERWLIFFDGEQGTTFAHRETEAFAPSQFRTSAWERAAIELTDARFLLGAEGSARGGLARDGTRASWDLSWERAAQALAAPLSLYPWRLLRDGPFPKSKLATPFPALDFAGSVRIGDEQVDVGGWTGMQGHNWGKEHAYEYAWGQCLFPGTPAAMVEGFTGRVKVGGWLTPAMSAIVVRRGDETYRFDRLFDFWRQEADVAPWRWRARLESGDGEVELFMDAGERPMVCLGYHDPDGSLRYCYNSKLARTRLRVRPRRGSPFELESAHGGALELLKPVPHPDFPEVV